MLTALPVNREYDLARRFVHVCNDIDNQHPNQLLAHAHCDTRGIPGNIEVLCELRKVISGSRCRRSMCHVHAYLAGLDTTQCRFPVLLQLRGDQAVIRIAGGIASLCQRGFVLSLLQFEFNDAPLLAQGVHKHLFGLQGCLYRQWLYDTHQFSCNRGIYAGSTEPHTPRRQVKAMASVNRSRGASSICHCQSTPAACASQQARQEGLPATRRFYVTCFAIGVGGEQLLVSLEFCPVYVAFVVFPEQNLPLLERLAVFVGLVGTAINDGGLLPTLAINIGSRIERIPKY